MQPAAAVRPQSRIASRWVVPAEMHRLPLIQGCELGRILGLCSSLMTCIKSRLIRRAEWQNEDTALRQGDDGQSLIASRRRSLSAGNLNNVGYACPAPRGQRVGYIRTLPIISQQDSKRAGLSAPPRSLYIFEARRAVLTKPWATPGQRPGRVVARCEELALKGQTRPFGPGSNSRLHYHATRARTRLLKMVWRFAAM